MRFRFAAPILVLECASRRFAGGPALASDVEQVMVQPDLMGVLRCAAVGAGGFIAWLVAFERWLEPLFRRCAGVLVKRDIVWVRAAGRFRMWGVRDSDQSPLEGAIGFLGNIAVLLAAWLPALTFRVTATAQLHGPAAQASVYLMSFPMVGVFVFRVLSGAPAAP